MLGCGIAVEHDAPRFMPQEEAIDFLRGIKEPYAFISHNAPFDASILAFRYNIHPDVLVCTLSMARALLLHKIPNGRLSLANVMAFMGIGTKGDAIVRMSGRHFRDTPPELMMDLVGYTLTDVVGCREIFFRLKDEFPAQEALILDRVMRMITQPKLHADIGALATYHAEIIAEKQATLARVNHDKTQIMSNPQFAELLREYGVEPPTKTSLITGKQAYAFAKTDPEFVELLDHPDIRIQTLVSARLNIKSTIEETRTDRFWHIAHATKGNLNAPLMPVPLKYGGAHTHRFSGDWKLNMQNLSARKSTRLREALIAPLDHVILAIDAKQIEARLVAWLAQQENLLNLFATGADVYSAFASRVLSRPINKRDNPVERFNGKTCVLGLGFGMGENKLFDKITFDAKEEGYDVTYTHDETKTYVNFFRSEYWRIKELWRRGQNALYQMLNTPKSGLSIGPCKVEGRTILLPSGLRLYYHNLELDTHGDFWFTYGPRRKKVYGAKVIENIVQALDRQHTLEAAIRTEVRASKEGIDGRLTSQIHDENLYVVRRSQWRRLAEIAVEEMRRPCKWAECLDIPLPLDAEVKMGMSYGTLNEIQM